MLLLASCLQFDTAINRDTPGDGENFLSVYSSKNRRLMQ